MLFDAIFWSKLQKCTLLYTLRVQLNHEIYPAENQPNTFHDSPRGIFHDLTVHLKCTKVYIFATLTKQIASNSINHSIRFQSVTSSHFFSCLHIPVQKYWNFKLCLFLDFWVYFCFSPEDEYFKKVL